MRTVLTAEQARSIMEAHEIDALLMNEEEIDLLERNNPELLTAYQALEQISYGE